MDLGLKVENLNLERGQKQVLAGFSLALVPGELVAVTGPNGVGKSSLALAIMGHPSCQITSGQLSLDGRDLTNLKTHERAKLGLFLAHQEPPAIPGITVADALQTMAEALHSPAPSTAEFYDALRAGIGRFGLPAGFSDRQLHTNFSGGEKKRAELLSLLVLKPRYGILDEIDSGLDAVARALTLEVLAELRSAGTGILVISHNDVWIKGLSPTREYVLK